MGKKVKKQNNLVLLIFVLIAIAAGFVAYFKFVGKKDAIDRLITFDATTFPAELKDQMYIQHNIDRNKYYIDIEGVSFYDGAVYIDSRLQRIDNPEGTSGQYDIWYKKSRNWVFLVAGQDDPMCSTLEQIKIGKGLNCYDDNNQKRIVAY